MNRDCNVSTITADCRFWEIFGCSIVLLLPSCCGKKLCPIQRLTGMRMFPCLMLWVLIFLKTHAKETALSGMAGGADKKTFRKWIWLFVCAIAALESDVVSGMATRAPTELSLLHSNTHN